MNLLLKKAKELSRIQTAKGRLCYFHYVESATSCLFSQCLPERDMGVYFLDMVYFASGII